MTFTEFKDSLKNSKLPHTLSPCLQALWYDGKGDWDRAHKTIQDIDDRTAAWVHAYLHRKEGDIWNADYWYARAGKKRPSFSPEEEWEYISKKLSG